MKTLTIKTLCLILMLNTLIGCKTEKKSETKAEEKPQTLDEQVAEIMQIWPGTFNNDKQIAKAEANGENVWRLDGSGKNGYLHVQSHYLKLDAPEIGENVLYVEEYRDHQPDSTYRQRIYTIFIDSIEKQIRVKMWPFKDKKKYVGAWKNPEVLKNLKVDEISAYPDKCDLLVEKKNKEYHMKMNGKDCAFGDKVFNYQVKLKESTFSYRDKITSLSNDEIVSAAAFSYHQLNRIK